MAPIASPARPQTDSKVRAIADCSSPALINSVISTEAPRIALLTPYSGGNLGDAAIQDSMISNLRMRLPRARFSGISLNDKNYREQHGADAFPICAKEGSYYGMEIASVPAGFCPPAPGVLRAGVRRTLLRFPAVRRAVKAARTRCGLLGRELRHWRNGYRFLRDHELLVVSGGGQLDEEWGGPWGHPFALFKWMLLARLAGVPAVFASVGACKVRSRLSRFFLANALKRARYRSYRDKNSRGIAVNFLSRAQQDAVVPDLAFGLPAKQRPRPAELMAMARGRTIVAISPISYGKPGVWPSPDRALFDRYLEQLTQTVRELVRNGYFLVFLWSARSDQKVIAELRGGLDQETAARFEDAAFFPALAGWKDALAVMEASDYLVASRLHSVIFGFLACIPVVAISFDPKVDWFMEEMGQEDALLQIRTFSASDVSGALGRLESQRDQVVGRLTAYAESSAAALSAQFDVLSEIAIGADFAKGRSVS